MRVDRFLDGLFWGYEFFFGGVQQQRFPDRVCCIFRGFNGNSGDPGGRGGPCTPDDGKEVGYQLEKPADGEEIAVLHTSMGDIRIRLFPDAAPKAVENFKGLINDGYYNGIVFHRVIDNFMIQGGDPTATGSGGESIWGEPFEDEFNTNLINLRGALSMANSGVDTNGSQFLLCSARIPSRMIQRNP